MQKSVEMNGIDSLSSFINLLLLSLIISRLLSLLLLDWSLFLNRLFLRDLGIFFLDLRFLLIHLMTLSIYDYLSVFSNHLITLHFWSTLHLVHTIASCSILSSLWWKYTWLILLMAHLSYLIFILHMRLPVFIQLFFLKYSLFIEKPFGKGVILFLDSFRFSFSNSHIETCWPLYSCRMVSNFLDNWFWYRCNWAPFSTTDFYQFIQ